MLRFGSGTYNLRDSETHKSKPSSHSPLELDCSVFFLDDSEHSFKVQKNASGEELLEQVFDFLELTERDFFGLQYVCVTGNNSVCLKWMDPKKSIRRQMMCPPYHLFFRLKFYISDPSKLLEEYTRYLVYLQLRKDLLDGRIPCSEAMAVTLAGFAIQSEFGDFNDSEEEKEYINTFQLVPFQNNNLSKLILEAHEGQKGLSPADAELKFLETARCLDFYGFDLYEAQDGYERQITIGVNANGISVFENGNRVHSFPWGAIIKVSFKRKNFLLNIVTSGNNNESVDTELSFNALTSQNCKMLWKSCIEHHTFFRLAVPPVPSSKSVFHLGSRFRYSGRTEYQSIEESKRFSRPERHFKRAPLSTKLQMIKKTDDSNGERTFERDSSVDRDLTLSQSQASASAPKFQPRRSQRRRFVERTSSLLRDNLVRRKLSQMRGIPTKSATSLLHSFLPTNSFKPQERRNQEQDYEKMDGNSSNNESIDRNSSKTESISSSVIPPDPQTSKEISPALTDDPTEDVSHNRKADRHSAVTDGSTHEIPKALTTSLQSLGLDDFDSCTSDLYSLSQPLDSVRSTSPYETVALQVNGKIKRKSTTPKQPSYQEEKELSNGQRNGVEGGSFRNTLRKPVPHNQPRINKDLQSSIHSDFGTFTDCSDSTYSSRPPLPEGSSHHNYSLRRTNGHVLTKNGTEFPAHTTNSSLHSQRKSITSVSELNGMSPQTAAQPYHRSSTTSRASSPKISTNRLQRVNSNSPPSELINKDKTYFVVRLQPDSYGHFGFNVAGGADCLHPVIISRIIAGSPADRCVPRLNEGDQVLKINDQEIAKWPYANVVNYIRSLRSFGSMAMTIKPNVYRCGLVDDEKQKNAPEVAHLESGPQTLVPSLRLLKDLLKSEKFVKQFESLYRTNITMSMKDSELPGNVQKNRYQDIRPYDATRVMLEKAPSGDYINASHVNMEILSTGIVNRYIATQGPLPHTCGDFWYMVWEQCSTLIVMLTTTVECDRVKCHQYWPSKKDVLEYGHLVISNLGETNDQYCYYRELSVKNKLTREERRVTQIQYIAWPDHGVPENSKHFTDFVGEVRRARNGSLDPIVVHCSAGIGRTGVLILMETAACLIESNEPVYPLDIVKVMRDQRAMLIQTTEQYKFVCECILRSHQDGIIKPLAEYQKNR